MMPANVRFSNRPVGVKRFQTFHCCSVDVAHGLVLLFGIGTKALPSWDSKTRWNDLWVGVAVRRTVGPSRHANSPHPSSREGHHATARWSSSFLLLDLILHGFHAAAAAFSRVQRNAVPSTHMRSSTQFFTNAFNGFDTSTGTVLTLSVPIRSIPARASLA